MFRPYASNLTLDKSGCYPVLGTLTGTARVLYGFTKASLNGLPAIINKVAKGNFGERGEASIDGLKSIGRGLIEIIPFAGAAWYDFYDFKLYRIKNHHYRIETSGIYLWYLNKAIYEGPIKKGKPYGSGHISFPHHCGSYEGELLFRMNQITPSGEGNLMDQWGNFYQGYWDHLRGTFKGTVTFANGSKYEGCMLTTNISFLGPKLGSNHIPTPSDAAIFFDPTSLLKEGKGKLTLADGTYLKGEWTENSLINNHATVFYLNGDYYRGQIRLANSQNGPQIMKHGNGYFYHNQTRTGHSGNWSQNHPVQDEVHIKMVDSVEIDLD